MPPLKILHVMRAPVGGLFRHVADLSRAQTALGHSVGIVADAVTGGAQAEATLASLGSTLALGVTRLPMPRHIGVSDFSAARAVAALARERGVDVLHGHGAKGGAYARLTHPGEAIRVYTPHGGSLHYSRSSPIGFLYLTLERALMPRTDLFLFESAYGRDTFRARVGEPRGLVRVVHNGVTEAEFAPVALESDATDLLFIGELRMLKGVDVLLNAIASLRAGGRSLTATIVGDGPDAETFRALATTLQLQPQVRFLGAMPARTAFGKGRLMVAPSRAESLPYIVLEVAAAGKPLIATAVGGIGEIFGKDADALVAAGDADALARRIALQLDDIGLTQTLSERLQTRVRTLFSVDTMCREVLAGYAEARNRR